MTVNLRNFEKDPDAIIDYSIDWSDWLQSDTISTGTWVVPAGIIETQRVQTESICTIYLSSGTAGNTYSVTNRITTANGRVNDQTIFIIVRNL